MENKNTPDNLYSLNVDNQKNNNNTLDNTNNTKTDPIIRIPSTSSLYGEKSESTRQVNKNQNTNNTLNNTEPVVGKIHEAPEFLRDNEFIHSGYRINFNSKWKIVKSLFVLHNEFVNVWSHILGAVFVVVLIVYTAIYLKSHKFSLENFE